MHKSRIIRLITVPPPDKKAWKNRHKTSEITPTHTHTLSPPRPSYPPPVDNYGQPTHPKAMAKNSVPTPPPCQHPQR